MEDDAATTMWDIFTCHSFQISFKLAAGTWIAHFTDLIELVH